MYGSSTVQVLYRSMRVTAPPLEKSVPSPPVGKQPMASWWVCRARPICLRLFWHWRRAAASRTFCTAGSSRPISTAMMAITTSSSINVNARRTFETVCDMSNSSWKEPDSIKHTSTGHLQVVRSRRRRRDDLDTEGGGFRVEKLGANERIAQQKLLRGLLWLTGSFGVARASSRHNRCSVAEW